MNIPAGRVTELLAPALDVLWSIHLGVQGHPGCPLKQSSETAINGLLQLLQEAKSEAAHEQTP